MTPSHLYRLAGLAGLACAVLLVVNSARRGGLFALSGRYLWQRVESGVPGLIGYALNAAGLAGAFAIEYVLHFAALSGRSKPAFTVTAVILIAGVLTFAAASFRARRLPAAAVALYAAGMVPGSLRGVVPL